MGEIDIEVKVCMKMWSELASMIFFFIETQSTTKELQNKTNPRSIALLVWKWRSDEGDRVRENPSKPSKFCLFTVLNHIVTGGEAKTSQYLDTIQQKSYFLSFLMQFSDFKSQNWVRKCVVFFCPDWLEKPCICIRPSACQNLREQDNASKSQQIWQSLDIWCVLAIASRTCH